jgi:hypothetical protein
VFVWQMVYVFLLSGLSAGLDRKGLVCWPHIHLLPPDDGPQMGPKHVEAWLFNAVRTNNASCWFIVQINGLVSGFL